MRRKRPSESPRHADVAEGTRYGCQNNPRGAATSGLTTPTAPNQTPTHAKTGGSASTSMRKTTRSPSRGRKSHQQLLLEGEEMRKLAKSSEQTAAPGSPSTFSTSNTPSTPPTVTPANSEATAQPRRFTHARAHPNPCASRMIFGPGEWCTLAPPPLASRHVCAPLGPSRKTQTKQGSDDGGRRCAAPTRRRRRPSVDKFMAGTADAPKHDRQGGAAHPSQPAYIDASTPLSLYRPST